MRKLQIRLILSITLLALSCAKNTPFDDGEPSLGVDRVVEIHIAYGEHAEKFNLLTSYQVIKANGTLPTDFHVSGIESEPTIDQPATQLYHIEDYPVGKAAVTYTTSHPVSEAGILFVSTTNDPDFTEFDVTVTFKVAGKVVDAPRVLTLTTDLQRAQGLSVVTSRPDELLEPAD